MPRYYRFGYQAYPYMSNWQGVPWHPSKPPHMEFGDITPSRTEKQLLALAALGVGAYLIFIRKARGGKTLFRKWRTSSRRRGRRRLPKHRSR